MSKKSICHTQKPVGEIFRFLLSLISLGHKLKEQGSEKLGNFVLVVLMLRDSVGVFNLPERVLKYGIFLVLEMCPRKKGRYNFSKKHKIILP